MSEFTITKFPIWTTEIDDVAGATTGLFKALAEVGVDVQFALGRPQADKPGKAILFISGIHGKKQEDAAKKAEFRLRSDVVGVQVQGPNRIGGDFKLTAALANGDLTVRALVATVDGDRSTVVFALTSNADADEAIKILHKVVDAD